MIDWTVNVGHLITVFTMLGGVMAIFWGLRSDVRILRNDFKHIEKRQDSLDSALKQLGTILAQLASQNTRLDLMQKQMDELRHGKGFVREK